MTKLTALAATVAIAIVAAGCGSVAEQNDYVDQVNARADPAARLDRQDRLRPGADQFAAGGRGRRQPVARLRDQRRRDRGDRAARRRRRAPRPARRRDAGPVRPTSRGAARARRRQRPARGRGGRRPAARDEQGPGADSGPDRPDQRRARELAVVPHHVVHPGLLGGWGCRSHPVQGGHRMKLHANARTCPNSRRLIVRRIEEEGWSLAAAAEAAGVSERTAAQVARPAGEPRARPAFSIAPRRRGGARRSCRPSACEAIEALRRLRMTAAEIAECLGWRSRRSRGG